MWPQAQERGVYKRRQATANPRQKEPSRAAQGQPCGPRSSQSTNPGRPGQGAKEELTRGPQGSKPQDWCIEGVKKAKGSTRPSSTCPGGEINAADGGRMGQGSGTIRRVR